MPLRVSGRVSESIRVSQESLGVSLSLSDTLGVSKSLRVSQLLSGDSGTLRSFSKSLGDSWSLSETQIVSQESLKSLS